MTGVLVQICMYWLSILMIVVANPLVGAIALAAIIAVIVLVFRWFGWLWGFGLLTLVGLITGPALLLTPVIVVVMGLARFRGPSTNTPVDETIAPPRPILPEPRVADQNR